jgi:hypothetical protein
MLRLLMPFAVLLLQVSLAHGQQPTDQVGDAYEIRRETVSESNGSNGSRSSSSSRYILIERVIAIRDEGVELEFDLPAETSAEDRARTWQFPARVLKPADGPLQLLNAPELDVRIRSWLELGGMTEAHCGRWIFTWSAFKIECDAQSVLGAIEAFDLRINHLGEGQSYRETGAVAPAPLRLQRRNEENGVLVAESELDAEAVRRERAQSDVIVAEMMGQSPLTLEAALQARSAERISGTIVTTLETDASARVTRRTRVTQIVTVEGDGTHTEETTTDRVERRVIAP